MTQCWPLQGMSAPQKAVLISLADNSNDDGVCWPSVAKIAERTCLSERAVRNALRWLEDAKVLVSHPRHGRSTWYTVTPASYAPGTTCPPAPGAAPPRHDVPPTPAPGAPRTVIEPSSEPSVETTAAAEDAKSKKTACPVEAIVDLFNEVLPELP
ncbi:TPA: helix-turn-helix domain-containing protein, partial [Pseudomonas aeruginosa]|nr:helix-turn-helix domain-containing protein [Pseudomonas aeruginosa]